MTLLTFGDESIREDLKGAKRKKNMAKCIKHKRFHCSVCGKMEKKYKGVIPATKRGKIAVKRLGRTKKTGGFAKIAAKAAKEYGSKESGQRVAAAVYWKKVKARGRK